ncbi:hypothetical protein QBC34DRAFT_488602 [Podospora aff. communis PSN243]|uniref:MYND-type domain-containing protein n=1 Tax=Podospora aff. communis PSN243 TaxID=3040156 RepID=A0AAV9G664_9PEZI|nr:hypothetical protein QBC34DRAFT_488602 [Podospora aff. communis PSN243]
MAPTFPCANCLEKEATTGCGKCLLVAYCGAECQAAHWQRHKADCELESFAEAWKPQWMLEKRLPYFVAGNGPKRPLNLKGEDYAKDLNVLFAASGDFRNVVTTSKLGIVLNDIYFDVVARNVIFLLIALAVEDRDEAADCIIHTWYAPLVRQSDLDILQGRVRPLIEAVVDEIKKADEDAKGKQKDSPTHEKTWSFGRRTLKVVLSKSEWSGLLSFLEIPDGLGKKKARKLRHAVTLNKDFLDDRDRAFCNRTPAHRIAVSQYWEDGFVLPLGAPRQAKFCCLP